MNNEFSQWVFRWMLSFLILVMSTVSFADYEFEKEFGSFGSSAGQFNDPRGVAVTSSNEIVLTESGNNRIQICTDQGSCTTFGSFGIETGQFDRPRGVAVDNSGNIVIADRGNDRIQICTESGSCDDMGGSGTAVGQFESPRGVAVNSQGQIVVADTENNRIQVCSTMGNCSAFGSLGSSPGQFDSPAGVAIDSQNRILVTDRLNDRIQICTAQGSCTAFGRSGSGLGQFNGPTGIAVDSQNRIVIVDRFNHRIQVCTSQGSCSAFGSFGRSAGLFDSPWGVAVDKQNRIIVADLGNNRIQIFSEPVAVAINSFSVSASSIEAGQSVTLSWSVDNATECTPLGGASGWTALFIDPIGGSTTLSINSAGSFTFTLRCSGGGETTSSSVTVSVTEPAELFHINSGLNDAWFNLATNGQGFFIMVFPELKQMFLAWFTYDTERPPEDVSALLGEPGHRWLTAQGPFDGGTANLTIFVTEGGVFDAAQPAASTDPAGDGSMTLEFADCTAGLVNYSITSLGISGEIPIQRLTLDNVPLCELLNKQLQ